MVSIIILCWNKVHLTKRCVEALYEVTPEELFELILVDNASTDETPEYLKTLLVKKNVLVITNKENRGFSAGNNQGAKLSQREYLCLLNNDTIPREGWLEAMLECFQDKSVGIVGAKLLYADESIQHAGISFQKNGIPYHRFRKYPSQLHEVNILGEVPGVTFACALIGRSLWDKLGGLDERYLVANYEDVDFNLRVREAGFKVVYQPKSVLTHYEAESTPKDYSVQYRTMRNLHFLLDRWYERILSDSFNYSIEVRELKKI